MKTVRWVLAGVVAMFVVVSAGTFVYIHFIEGSAPARLSIDTGTTVTTNAGTAPADTAAASGEVAGTWKATAASQVGYRVKETLFGQSNTAVGRTNRVSGSMVVDGTTVKSADIDVDMTTVSSDQTRRDGQFRGRIMNVATYPTASFKLTSPITLSSTTGTVKVNASGELTLHGVTKAVTVPITAVRSGTAVKVNGSIPVVFADFNIANPSFGGTVTTDDNGLLEFLVVFEKSA